jgi:mono/diheme cytochrome c family protein
MHLMSGRGDEMKTLSGMALVLAAFAVCFSTVPAAGLEPENTPSFGDGVLPILQSKCAKCHDGSSKKGGVDLSSFDLVMGKKLVVAGSPEKSKLYTIVTGASPKMPKNGGPLSKAETDLIAAWIKAGATNSPPSRTALASADEALKAAKDGSKPVILLFCDGTPKTKLFIQSISDPSLDQSFAGVAYAAVTFEKESEEAKKYKVTAAPTLLILDPRPEMPKELKKLTSGAPAGLKSAIAAAIKAFMAK